MSPLRNHKISVLASGGLDSAVLLAYFLKRKKQVRPLFVQCGLRWEAAELYWLKRYLRAIRCAWLAPLRVVDLPMASLYGDHWAFRGKVPGGRSADSAVYLPGRNVILIGAAAVVCAQDRSGTLAIGTLAGNPFGDASDRFFRSYERVLTNALQQQVVITAPLREKHKVDLIREWQHLPLDLTFSCLSPQGRTPCGRCNKCAERQRGFRSAGAEDKTRYAN